MARKKKEDAVLTGLQEPRVEPEGPKEPPVPQFTPNRWAQFQHLPTRVSACRVPVDGEAVIGSGEIKQVVPCVAGDYILRYPDGSKRVVPESAFKRYYQPVNDDGAAMMRGA